MVVGPGALSEELIAHKVVLFSSIRFGDFELNILRYVTNICRDGVT